MSGGAESESTVVNAVNTVAEEGTTDGGTESGSTVSSGDVSRNTVSDGDVSGNDVSGGDVSGNDVSSGDVSGNDVSIGDVSGNAMSSGDVSGNTVSSGDVSGNTVSSGDVSSNESLMAAALKKATDYYLVTFTLINNVPENQIPEDGSVIVYMTDASSSYYVAEGGNCNMIITEENIAAGEFYSVPAERVYFKGGLQNTEVLRSMAFGMTGDDAYAINIQVDTVTPGMLNLMTEAQILQYDMVYIGNATLWNYIHEDENYVYTYQENLAPEQMEYLAAHIVTSKIPCMVDLSEILLMGEDTATGEMTAEFLYKGSDYYPNLDKLILLMISSNKDRFFEDTGDGNEYTYLNETFKSAYVWNSADAGEFALNNIIESDGENGETYILAADTDNDLHFVRENVWAFYSPTHPVVKRGFGETEYEATVEIPGGFQVVLDEIISENLYREADISSQPLAEVVNDETVIRYLLNYQKRRVSTVKTAIDVLEIEPATNAKSLSEDTVASWIGIDDYAAQEDVTINITTMPITQFIGIINDLNAEYDLIYFGDSVTGFNTQYSGGQTITDFNDDTMDGLLYCHVGDSVVAEYNLSGVLTTEVKTTSDGQQYVVGTSAQRYSGNDITIEKYNALMDYLQAKYPIVVANSLVNVSADGSGNRSVNGNRIDNSSYLYEFLQYAYSSGEYKNVFRVNDLSAGDNGNFDFYINREKLQMTGVEIVDASAYSTDANNQVMSISKQADGNYYYRCRFTIENRGAVSAQTDYTCNMYLDANADGKFSQINEGLFGLEIRRLGKDSTGNDVIGDKVNRDELRAGETYMVTRQIPEGYMGCVTWKLEITQSSNELIRTSQTGYVKLQSNVPALIKVLQIYFHPTTGSNLILESQVGTLNANKTDYMSDGNSSSQFYQLLRSEEIKKEYLLDITSISKSEFDDYVNYGVPVDDSTVDVRKWMEQFDMLIVGFSDAYNGTFSNDWTEESVNEIKDFISSGRSVLLSHDMTSIVSTPKEATYQSGSSMYMYYENDNGNRVSTGFPEYYWGYNMNRYVRNMLGMDMYGVTMSYSGGGASYDRLLTGQSMSSGEALFDSLNQKADPVTGRYLNYNMKDLAYTPKSGRTSTVPEVQGFSYAALSTRATVSFSQKTYRTGIRYTGNGRDPRLTSEVVKTNEGQITNYPYYVGDSISVATTHNQYYTLDMNSDADGDMQTDLVVWYCLAGSEAYYANSYQDVRNNYYIYSKGNVTYTGMGHEAYTNGYERITSNEAKLFVNTMIASYQASKRSPEVLMVNSAGIQKDTIYNFFEVDSGEDVEEDVKVYFNLQDLNMVTGSRRLQVRYYIENRGNDSPDKEMDGCPVTDLTDLTNSDGTKILQTFDMKGNPVEDLSNLESDTVYYVVIPAKYFKPSDANGNEIEFFIDSKTTVTITSMIDGSQRTVESAWGYGKLSYMNCDLFDLD